MTVCVLVCTRVCRALPIHHITSIRRVVVVGVVERMVVDGLWWMGFAPDSAHALPFAGCGPVNLSARNLTWGLARGRTLPSFNDRGPLRGESVSVWGLEGPTSTSADLFYDSEAQSRDESSLGKRFVAGGGPLDVSGSPCNIITSVHGHIIVERGFSIVIFRGVLTRLIIISVVVVVVHGSAN